MEPLLFTSVNSISERAVLARELRQWHLECLNGRQVDPILGRGREGGPGGTGLSGGGLVRTQRRVTVVSSSWRFV